MSGRALAAALAVASASPAAANPVETVMSVISDVCLSHGGDADAVQSLAAARGWPALSDEEIAAIPWLNERPAFLAAWWVSGGEEPIILVIGTGVYTYWRSHEPSDGRTYRSIAAPEAGTADAQIPPELWSQPNQECTLFFGIEEPAPLEDRLGVLDVDGIPLLRPLRSVHRGARGVEGETLVSHWARSSATVTYSVVPDWDAPRAMVEISVPLVKAPHRQLPPLLR